jgi:serine/threonine protein kinase/tetratricopeptide (TPR) repeat protein
MGEVFLAEDSVLQRKVALKLLSEARKNDPVANAGVLEEARAAAAIDHPYICKVYETGKEGDVAFIAMEYVEGETLKDRIAAAPLPMQVTLELAVEILSALAAAHARGVLHRDLKPANVMLALDGHVRLMDFGMARRGALDDAEETQAASFQSERAAGTPAYMSPEQILGMPLDQRSDLFSMGIMLYEMLTGVHPFLRTSAMRTMLAITGEEASALRGHLPGCPKEVEQVVGKLLRREVGGRYRAAKAVLADLKVMDTRKREVESQRVAGAETREESGQPISASIAVLPFVAKTHAKQDEYLADGIADDIIAHLTKLTDMKVISRNSTMRYKGVEEPLEKVGREMDVDTVLEGTIRHSGKRLKITAGLSDVKTRRQLWMESYERDFKDVFAIQAEVALKIATTLRTALSADQKGRLEDEPIQDLDAYRLYLKGRHFLYAMTQESMPKAIRYFKEALDIDPLYARSYAAMASAYAHAGHFDFLKPRDAFPKAKAAAARALELDDKLADAHAAMGLVKLFFEWDWEGAQKELLRAIGLNPGDPDARMFYSWYLAFLGRFRESLSEARLALEYDPLSLFAGANVAWVLQMSSRYDEALEQYQRILEMQPNFVVARALMAVVYAEQEKHDEAIAILSEWNWTRLHLAQAHAMAGNRDTSLEILGELTAGGTAKHHSSFDIGLTYLLLQDVDAGFEWMEKALEERDNKIIYTRELFKRTPQLRALLEHPRCREVLRQTGLER